MLRRLLRLAEYDVATFGCGEEFLVSLDRRVPACAILDIHMPGLSGFEVQSRVRATGTELPVIFITANDEPSLDQVVLEARGVRLLRKPFGSDELLRAVDAALRSKPREAPR